LLAGCVFLFFLYIVHIRTPPAAFFVFLLFLASLAALLPFAGSQRILQQGDEVMHIATVRESARAGFWAVPRLTGLPNYYKPPLLFWSGMVAEDIFGEGLFQDRLPSFAAAFLSVLLVFLILKEFKLSSSRAFLGAFLYLFTVAIFKFSRLLMMEQGLTLFLLFVAWLWTRYFLNLNRSPGLLLPLLAGLASGGAYLYKGPIFFFYAGFVFIAWAFLRVYRFHLNPFVWRGGRDLRALFLPGLVFAVSSLIFPALWTLLLYTNNGAGVLKFFYVVENAGKFSSPNQPEMIIPFGWFLYTFPWTIPAGFFLIYALKKEVKNARRLGARVFLAVAFLITIFHLLPNRKDPYYVVPGVPFVILAMVVSDFFESSLFRRSLRFHLAFIALSGALAAFVLWILQASGPAALGMILVAALSLAGMFIKKVEPLHKVFFSGAIFLLAFQFLLLPALARPNVPAFLRAQRDLCIISPEPWDQFEFLANIPGARVRHSMPGAALSCVDGKNSVVLLRSSAALPEAYRLNGVWPVWKSSVDTTDIASAFSDPSVLFENARLFVSSKKTSGDL